MGPLKYIDVKKAKVHNLKSIDVKIPKDSLTVITGPSGSGKSSLAFDTIYIEGQRRYIESLSSYARQFLGQFNPPDVESISGLSPSLAIDQKSRTNNPRSTVGTITEIFDYLRVLYARVGKPHCPETGAVITSQTPEQISKAISNFKLNQKIVILAPLIRSQKGERKELLKSYLLQGFTKIRLNGTITEITDDLHISAKKKHNIDLVIDRFILKNDSIQRITESVEYALKISKGDLYVLVGEEEKEFFFSENNVSPMTGKSYPSLQPRIFSFNSPLGACPDCKGIGMLKNFSTDKLIVDKNLPILSGAMPLLSRNTFLKNMIKSILKKEKQSISTPYKSLSKEIKNTLINGSDTEYTFKFESENSTFNFKKSFSGISNWLMKKYLESSSEKVRANLEEYMAIDECPLCKGSRLNLYSLAVTVNGKNIMEASDLSIKNAFSFFEKIKFTGENKVISEKLFKEILARLKFLIDVGLGYLSLNRPANTLSGGESQRIRLATQIGSALSGVLYVLDEPSIGLHQRDNIKLIETLKSLRDLGNTVLVVEHDEDTMKNADYIIDIGPGAGEQGGNVVACGTFLEILNNPKSITGRYLSKNEEIPIPTNRREQSKVLLLEKAKQHNLKEVNLKVMLNALNCITGVSGSGKSTLIHQVLVPAVKAHLNNERPTKKNYKKIEGALNLQSLIELDQGPIGRTPKSNPATYSNVFTEIRDLFSSLPESNVRGYKAGRFSFNVKGGRCESCEGNGVKKIEMHFLPDVFITCDDCQGKRYNAETLSVFFKGKNIFDILNMSISEALVFFKNHRKINKILKTLSDVGLGYMKLGQPATTLSGGEAQRLKLARELARTQKGHCLYILDEPTTGLHFHDIKILLKAINSLIDQGHTMIIIEHNLDVIKTSDYIVDLGPEGGEDGGLIIAEGTPEEVSKIKSSYTGQFLKNILKN